MYFLKLPRCLLGFFWLDRGTAMQWSPPNKKPHRFESALHLHLLLSVFTFGDLTTIIPRVQGHSSREIIAPVLQQPTSPNNTVPPASTALLTQTSSQPSPARSRGLLGGGEGAIFAATALTLWNSLPPPIRNLDSLQTERK